ncbi:GDP-mannose 4,6-dehydratase [Tropicibacter sp. R15_0]|uniref:GDP-mannose 4,6-dehydratase n=1 Tax=Tropicibacter sp. R15_0 TaxID=2821101 RepID=UPI001ADB0484|nr:GDP-mannose 4,6-dehydratase [Tropicibacter sp. R15_0]MBO9467542.1 GDP-mannose 4,6-dehydratase [Tropicibacter sp. R15_0]
MKTALICGVSGQDGTYLAEFLLNKGYRVIGTSRDAAVNRFRNLEKLGIEARVETVSMAQTDFHSIVTVLDKYRPDEIYNLAGQSSVGLSFEQPIETFNGITAGVLNLMEAIRFLKLPCRLYNASSGDCFGDQGGEPCSEETAFRPISPYATAKAAAHWAVVTYRSSFDLFACNGILFNHESPLRPARFVTQKIVAGAVEIARNGGGTLSLGNLDISRDWGWAPEYVHAMWLMLQQKEPMDYVIATGQPNRLRDFCQVAFEAVGLNMEDHVISESSLLRPSDIALVYGDPTRAKENLGWEAQFKMKDVVHAMIEDHRQTPADT